jgi:hypothetical protein
VVVVVVVMEIEIWGICETWRKSERPPPNRLRPTMRRRRGLCRRMSKKQVKRRTFGLV